MTLDSAVLLYTYISRFSVNPHHRQKRKSRRRCHRNSVPNRFSSRFLTSPTNGPRSLSQTKMGTHSALGERSHTRAHTAKQRCFGWGWYHYPRSVPHVHEHPRAGCQKGVLCRFWSWSGVLPKNAESLRDSDALMRVAVPRHRGPAGLRSLLPLFVQHDLLGWKDLTKRSGRVTITRNNRTGQPFGACVGAASGGKMRAITLDFKESHHGRT